MSEHFASWAEAGIQLPPGATGQTILLCPRCSHTRSPAGQKKRCLSVNVEEGVWHCQHPTCGWSGRLSNGKTHITLTDLAANKRIPSAFLAELGIHDLDDGVAIPYHNIDGSLYRTRKRTALKAKEGSSWLKDGAGQIPYGLNRLQAAREAGHVALVEGESDCWTGWYHGYPMLGIPGAKSTKVLQAEHLAGISTVYAVQETDPAGAEFIEGLSKRLPDIGYRGALHVLHLPAKDPNELHKRDPDGFKAAFEAALKESERSPEKVRGARDFDAYVPAPRPAEILCVCVGDVTPQPVQWLWAGRIARGKLTVIAGDPGLGKSIITLAMSAVVTRGGRWPDGAEADIGAVILLSAEDDVADTIRPRLDAAGADVRHVHAVEMVRETNGSTGELTHRTFSLKRDVALLDGLLERCPDCALVVIDPVSAYLDGTDSHNNADVRGLLAPLSELAAKHRAAVVCVSHLNKSAAVSAMYRTTGSLAFVAAARCAYIVTKDKDRPERRLFLPLKNNLAADTTGLAYAVATAENGAPVITWERDPVTIAADEALAADVPEANEKRQACKAAAAWLEALLADGPIPFNTVKEQAKAAGFLIPTVRRAKDSLGVIAFKPRFASGWQWRLSDTAQGDHEQGDREDDHPPAIREVITLGAEGQAKLTLATLPPKVINVITLAAKKVKNRYATTLPPKVIRLSKVITLAETLAAQRKTKNRPPKMIKVITLARSLAAVGGTAVHPPKVIKFRMAGQVITLAAMIAR